MKCAKSPGRVLQSSLSAGQWRQYVVSWAVETDTTSDDKLEWWSSVPNCLLKVFPKQKKVPSDVLPDNVLKFGDWSSAALISVALPSDGRTRPPLLFRARRWWLSSNKEDTAALLCYSSSVVIQQLWCVEHITGRCSQTLRHYNSCYAPPQRHFPTRTGTKLSGETAVVAQNGRNVGEWRRTLFGNVSRGHLDRRQGHSVILGCHVALLVGETPHIAEVIDVLPINLSVSRCDWTVGPAEKEPDPAQTSPNSKMLLITFNHNCNCQWTDNRI